jgi:hypothetical protein
MHMHIHIRSGPKVSLNHSFALTGMLRLKPASQFIERNHTTVSCALNMENLSSNMLGFNSISNKEKESILRYLGPPLWSSGQSSGLDSRRYQIF